MFLELLFVPFFFLNLLFNFIFFFIFLDIIIIVLQIVTLIMDLFQIQQIIVVGYAVQINKLYNLFHHYKKT